MKAIYNKELKSYFSSPLGYVFIAVFALVSGFYFFYTNLLSQVADVSRIFLQIVDLLILIIPILTMRVYSEEKNKKTDQLLLTSPISVTSIVLGKFFAAFTVLAIALAQTIIFPIILSLFAKINWTTVFTNYIGFFLLGASFISVGIFISSLTENVLISAIASFGALFLINLMDVITDIMPNKFLAGITESLALTTKFESFSIGVIDISSVVYYLSTMAVFVLLTTFQIEKKRYVD